MAFNEFGREMTVTSLRDGHEHKPKSLHNKGLAADLRTRHLGKDERTLVFGRLKKHLDYWGYDVVLEPDHIHVEYQPKGDEDWQVEVS